jgi:hypothetical protein
MTGAVTAALLTLALLDGAFAGFRSSVGRTGTINHRNADLLAARRGTILVLILLTPVALLIAYNALTHHRLAQYTRAGEYMLAIYVPYGALVLAALAVYALLGWRLKYLASAVILGPFTLLRPAVAAAGAIFAAVHTPSTVGKALTVCAALAVLAVEPLADRLWYAPRAQ